jgi:hypothetical protein
MTPTAALMLEFPPKTRRRCPKSVALWHLPVHDVDGDASVEGEELRIGWDHVFERKSRR